MEDNGQGGGAKRVAPPGQTASAAIKDASKQLLWPCDSCRDARLRCEWWWLGRQRKRRRRACCWLKERGSVVLQR